jgi:bacterioferritin-associated ferredoxin
MIVCVCKAVSEKRIHQAVDEGVVSLRDLTRHLGVGTCCGKCVPMAREVLMDRLPPAPLSLLPGPQQGMPVAA